MDTRATDPTLTRRAGVLAHVSSLPGPRYCGDFGFAASNFFEWCRAAELRLWQVLPLGPTGRGHSPYSATSAFACNPTWFAQRGSPAGEEAARFDRCDLPRASRDRRRRLEESWRAFERDASSDRRVACESFRHSEEREFWLEDWTLYAALKEHHGERPWFEWDPELRRREPAALREAARELDERRRFHGWVQFELDRQARSVRASAEAHDIVWIGDLPFTVALDSADVWARREFFRVDDDGRPEVTAGVPPDAFSDAGQCWNTPLFDWIAMEQDGFAWWLARCRAALRWVHALRLDHFRGYAASWEIPFGAETAAAGRWQAVPGDALFEAVRGAGLDRRLF